MARAVLVVQLTLLVAMAARAQWTGCSAPCGGGERTSPELTISCHNFGCSYQADCPCGMTDIIFVMDESGSINSNNFWIQKQFAVDIVDGSRYSDATAAATTRVGFILFSSTVRTEFDLAAGYTASNPSTSVRIWDATYNGGGTSTWLGIDAAREMLEAQGQNDHKWIVVVITDGESSNTQTTASAAANLQATGASVYAIGIGPADTTELNAIASDPDENFMFHVENFDGLGAIIEEVLNGSCCDTLAPVCEVVAYSDQCTATCGGGNTHEYKRCSYINQYEEVLRVEWVNSTTSCCTQACPPPAPTVDDCAQCNFQAGIGYLHDPADCNCYYRCQDYGNQYYVIYPRECCMSGLYWDMEALTCNYAAPVEGCLMNPIYCDEFPPTTTTTTTTTTAPCAYHQDPEDPQKFLDENGQHAGTCASGQIWINQACACVAVAPPTNCEDDLVLYYTFDESIHDDSCAGAYTEKWPRLQQNNVRRIEGGKNMCATYNGEGFLSVAYMYNYFSGATVTTWTVSMWYKRTAGFNAGVGLINNGDCESDPSFAMYIDDLEMLVAVVRTTGSARSTNSITVANMRNQWVHVAMTYNGQYLKVYRNGLPAAHLEPVTGGLENKQCNMKIGHQVDPRSQTQGFFQGEMDEIMLYKKALTDADILAKYNNP